MCFSGFNFSYGLRFSSAGPWKLFITSRLRFHRILGCGYCYYSGCLNLSFGMPGASALASWGNLGPSWSTWEHKKGHFGIQSLIFLDFQCISSLHLESVSGTLNQHACLCSCLFPGCLQVAFLLVTSAVRKTTFRCQRNFKYQLFIEFGIFIIPKSMGLILCWDLFSWFLMPVVRIEIWYFHGCPWATSDLATRAVEENGRDMSLRLARHLTIRLHIHLDSEDSHSKDSWNSGKAMSIFAARQLRGLRFDRGFFKRCPMAFY